MVVADPDEQPLVREVRTLGTEWNSFWIEVALYAAKHDFDPDPAHRRDLQQLMVEWAARELDTHLDEVDY